MKTSKPAGGQRTEVYTDNKRPDFTKLFCLAGIIVSLIISACDFRKVEAQTDTNSKKGSNMESIQSTTTIQHKIPPIDAAALPGLETATFAMG